MKIKIETLGNERLPVDIPKIAFIIVCYSGLSAGGLGVDGGFRAGLEEVSIVPRSAESGVAPDVVAAAAGVARPIASI